MLETLRMLAQESGDKCTAFQILAQRAGIIGDRNPQPATPNWGVIRGSIAGQSLASKRRVQLALMLRRSSAAVATSREGHRSPGLGRDTPAPTDGAWAAPQPSIAVMVSQAKIY